MGGVSSVLYELTKYHKKSAYQYVILNLTGKGDASVNKKFEALEVPIYNANFLYTEGYTLIDQYKKAYFVRSCFKDNKSVLDIINNIGPSIIHTHVLPFELYVLRKVTRNINCLFIHTDHLVRLSENEMKAVSYSLIKFPFKKFYKNVHVIAVSDAVKNYLVKFGINKGLSSLQVITNKLPANSKTISYVEKPEYKVVYVARISEVKGHVDLIAAWRDLPKLNLHLYIIGPDELNGRIQELVHKSVINNKISFTGSINNVSKFISDADMAVFPSHKEGLPIALLEKMQIGIPCVVSDIDELKSIITDSQNGLIFKCGDTVDLIKKIIALASDLNLRKKLGVSAKLTVEEKFVSKLGGIDKEYELLYSKLLSLNNN